MGMFCYIGFILVAMLNVSSLYHSVSLGRSTVLVLFSNDNGQLMRQWLLKVLHWAVLYLLEFLRDTVNDIMINPRKIPVWKKTHEFVKASLFISTVQLQVTM
jgi:hypothetical protein